MRITYDSAKRDRTLKERGLDFEDAPEVFAGATLEFPDEPHDYGEVRWQTVGRLRGRLVILVWTERADARHIISMRKGNAREKKRYEAHLDRSG